MTGLTCTVYSVLEACTANTKRGARDLSGEVTARPRTVQAPQGVESPKVVRNRHAESRGKSRALDLNPAPDRSSEVRALDAAGET